MESAAIRRQSQKLWRARGLVAALAAAWLSLLSGQALAETIRLVAFGDSLTAGYRLAKSEAFPAVLERELKARGWDIAIANAGVSGDTAAAGAARVDWSVPEGTQGVILELGANDALRGLSSEETEKSLRRILDRLKARNIPVLIAGMYAPRSLGAQYYEKFDAIYPRLAQEYGHDLYPFFLDGILGDMNFNLEDGLHPNREGVARIVERILPAAENFLRRIRGS